MYQVQLLTPFHFAAQDVYTALMYNLKAIDDPEYILVQRLDAFQQISMLFLKRLDLIYKDLGLFLMNLRIPLIAMPATLVRAISSREGSDSQIEIILDAIHALLYYASELLLCVFDSSLDITRYRKRYIRKECAVADSSLYNILLSSIPTGSYHSIY